MARTQTISIDFRTLDLDQVKQRIEAMESLGCVLAELRYFGYAETRKKYRGFTETVFGNSGLKIHRDRIKRKYFDVWCDGQWEAVKPMCNDYGLPRWRAIFAGTSKTTFFIA